MKQQRRSEPEYLLIFFAALGTQLAPTWIARLSCVAILCVAVACRINRRGGRPA